MAQASKGPTETENFLRSEVESLENELNRLRQREHDRVTKEEGYQIEVMVIISPKLCISSNI